jgi:hypothetical protein
MTVGRSESAGSYFKKIVGTITKKKKNIVTLSHHH